MKKPSLPLATVLDADDEEELADEEELGDEEDLEVGEQKLSMPPHEMIIPNDYQ